MKTQTNHLLEVEGITTPRDFFYLSRDLSDVKRCAVIPVSKPQSIAEHLINCVHLLDFLHWQGYTSTPLTAEDLNKVRNYLLYHDIEEAVISDVPHHTNKLLGDVPNQVRYEIASYFGQTMDDMDPKLHALAKQIDMLEFVITIGNDPKLYNHDFDNEDGRVPQDIKKLKQVFTNGLEVMASMVEKAEIKVDFERFMKEIL